MNTRQARSKVNATPVLDNFCSAITEIIRARDGNKLQDYLQVEPPLSESYTQMIDELRQRYPKEAAGKEADLVKKCEGLMPPRARSGSPWIPFPILMRLYFTFLRDVNVENLLETYELLKRLLNQCVLALSDSQMGVIVLPTVLYLSKVLAKLALGLDRRPELIAHVLQEAGDSDREGVTEKITLVEKSANVVREAFIKCLTDRSSSTGMHGKPEGKRVGIYLMANLCLKLLFQCGKLRNAEQMFASINAQSPPLSYFPASQRVTYLYYLGRYLFSNNLFYPAQTALQTAYNQCHRQALSQRRLILTYLIPCNIILGRFPSQELLNRPEAHGLAERFIPLCKIISSGDITTFRQYMNVGSPATEWLARKEILLQLRNRCEVLVWRSLSRKVFIHAGFHGDPTVQRGPPPYLYLNKLEAAVLWLQSRNSSTPLIDSNRDPRLANRARSREIAHSLGLPVSSDFGALHGPVIHKPNEEERDDDDYMSPDAYFDPHGEVRNRDDPSLCPNGTILTGSTGPLDLLHEPPKTLHSLAYWRKRNAPDAQQTSPLMMELESILASLLTQGLMDGYLTHNNPRFAIPGARIKGALPKGFPNVWETIHARESEDDQVPGWVRAPPEPDPRLARAAGPGGAKKPAAMGGRVVNLSGAKPVGQR
ncbi:hypothetical protein FQN54_004521 [Arachnomyces sp. PD_36]|nr:hypothetical protein FQN54_004521 [Arachnomyces sp. PD_36]